jgi:hypothetical protein
VFRLAIDISDFVCGYVCHLVYRNHDDDDSESKLRNPSPDEAKQPGPSFEFVQTTPTHVRRRLSLGDRLSMVGRPVRGSPRPLGSVDGTASRVAGFCTSCPVTSDKY